MTQVDFNNDRRELAKQFVTYADAITAFSLVQSIAFGLALTQPELHDSVIRLSSYVLYLADTAYVIYVVLAALCFAGERHLLGNTPTARIMKGWRIVTWVCRLLVLVLAFVICRVSVCLTVKQPVARQKNTDIVKPCSGSQQTTAPESGTSE